MTVQKEEQEKLRKKIDGAKCIDSINASIKELKFLDKEIKTARSTKQRPTRERDVRIKAHAREKVLKTIIDSEFKKLNKALPDLRSTELSNPDGEGLFSGFGEFLKTAVDKK